MKYSTIKYFCTSNGIGVRTAVFVSGCNLHCEGCFNKIAWDFDYGKELTEDKIDEILDSIEQPYIKGLSILGGEPMDDKNCEGVLHLLERFRERFGNTKDVWLWSGYYIEETMKHEIKKKALLLCDYVVDGPFIKDLYSNNLLFKGSSNQRIMKINGKKFEKVDL